jgi:hypothetical protein
MSPFVLRSSPPGDTQWADEINRSTDCGAGKIGLDLWDHSERGREPVARQEGTCQRCDVPTMVVTVHAMGEPLSIVMCPMCGDRRWASALEQVHLDQVIARFRQASAH